MRRWRSNNRMTIKVRLLLGFALVCLALVAAPLTIYMAQSSRALRSASLKQAGVAPSKALLKMVQLQQQHRGLSSGVLGGNNEMDAHRAAKQAETDKAVGAFDAIVKSHMSDAAFAADWRRAADAWKILANGVSSRSISGQDSFAEHTALIGDNLKLLDQMLDYFGLSYDPTGNDYHLTMALLVHMPTLAEFLGQARARGMLLLTEKRATLADRTALIGLISNVERQHEYMARELDKAMALNPKMKTTLGHIARGSLMLAQMATHVSRTRIVDAETLRYSPTDYLSICTQAIDGQFALLDQAMVDLESALQARIAGLRNGQDMTISFIALVIAVAIWLGTVLVRTIKQDIATLQKSEEAQRRHADELEATVEARTRELRAANAQLEVASRLKSDFLTHISHELRTPLNAILGFSELLRNPAAGPLKEEQTRYLTHIQASGKHLLVITNDLLDLAKAEAGKLDLHPEPFEVDQAVMAALADIRPLADQKRLVLTLHADTALIPLTADLVRFRQILYNILSNAIKFTPEGGRITVTASVRSEAPEVSGRREAFEAGEAPHFIEITVIDTGIGITAENLTRLFQPYSQLDASLAKQYHGTGLGLALTKQLVELHNGRIWATSAGKGRGSCFTIRFPLAPQIRPELAER